MYIPEILKHMGKSVPISWVTTAQGHDDAGSYCTYTDNINLHPLSEGISEEGQAECLLHEIIERINATCDLKMKHTQISTISAELFAAIRDNNLDFRRPHDNKDDSNKSSESV